MTQRQLVCSVASATGESICTVRARGFGLVTKDPDDHDPEDLRLFLDCPFCRKPLPYPGNGGNGVLHLADCPGCDVEFPFEVDEVYVAGGPGGVLDPVGP
jgi:hypothetical protein